MKKIINVRKGLVTMPFIASLLVIGITSYSNKQERDYIEYKELTREPVVAVARNTQNSNEIIDKQEQDTVNSEKRYYAGDILVVNAYNPETQRQEYYFMELCDSRSDYLSKDVFSKKFVNTPFIEKIEAEEAICKSNYYLYKSIFDDETTYSMDSMAISSDIGTGMTTTACLQTSAGISVCNINDYMTMKNNKDNISNSYSIIKGENTKDTYWEKDNDKYTIYTDCLYLENNDYLTIEELKNLLNDLRGENNLGGCREIK